MVAAPAATGEPLLRADRLTRRADGRTIVEDITVEVRAGEVVAIVGTSGAGKSSFLRLLNRLDEPTAGTVYLAGIDYRTVPARELRRRVGLVLQSARLFPGTVADNLRFGPAARGERLDDGVVEGLLRRVDLEGYGEHPVERLSGGEAQRVALARALAKRAPLGAAALMLGVMLVFAAAIAAGRVRGVPGAFPTALIGIGAGSGAVILAMVAFDIVRADVTDLVSVGSMILANSMNTCALALERLRSELDAHRGYVEAGLSLGAAPAQVTAPYVQRAVRASLIPRLDSLSSLGIVWIPGLMAGMVLSGAYPMGAALFQFVTIALVLAAGGLTSLVCVRILRARAFTSADQLALPAVPAA